MKKYFIVTFGCQMNKSDSERIKAVLEKMNYKEASKINEADSAVINMCSVRQTAVDRVYGLFLKFKEIKKKKPHFKAVLTGCVLKKDFKKFSRFFDFILPIKTLDFWPEILKEKNYLLSIDQRNLNFTKKLAVSYLKVSPKYSKDFSVFIPISTGCNNFCTYCVVPYARGPLICRPHKEILKEVESSVKKGAKEVWLLGQNVNDYQSPADHSIDFSKLLEMTNNIEGDFWLSFLSSNPKDFSDNLIKVIAKCKKINKYLSLPIQSGDDEVLKKMNRQYSVREYKDLVKKIRQKIPDIFLSTDIIVGFPGETKKQFQNTLLLLKKLKFDMAYIAEYSVRPETKAYKMKDDVPEKEKVRRREALTEILIKGILENSKRYIGKKFEVLVSECGDDKKEQFCIGKTRNYKTVKFQVSNFNPQDLLGKIVKVKIVDVLPWGLKGELKL